MFILPNPTLSEVTFAGQRDSLNNISSCVIPEATCSEVYESVHACAKLGKGEREDRKRMWLETYHLVLIPFIE